MAAAGRDPKNEEVHVHKGGCENVLKQIERTNRRPVSQAEVEAALKSLLG